MLNPSLVLEQAATLSELYEKELPELVTQPITLPKSIRRVYALGNGDSYHALLSASQAFCSWTNIEYHPVPAYTFMQHELHRLSPEDATHTLVVCISASGSSTLATRVLDDVHRRGLGMTLSITGKHGNNMDQAADYILSTAITEKGRTPGIRTFAASLCGMLCLAGYLSECNDHLRLVAETLQRNAPMLEDILSKGMQIGKTASQWSWPLCTVLGCDSLQGCAQFVSAKMVEISGVYAAGQEMEEWCHVESMAYPLDAPVIVLLGSTYDRKKALSVMELAHRAGRKVMLVSSFAQDDELQDNADESIFLALSMQEEMNSLFHYIPLLPLAQCLAEKKGRAMFLSDQPFRLF